MFWRSVGRSGTTMTDFDGMSFRVVGTEPRVRISAPGFVSKMVLKEGPTGPAGQDGNLITITDNPPDNADEGTVVYDTSDPGIDGTAFVMRCVHNGTSYPSRPPVTYVEWVGPTEPPDWVEGDTWTSEA